MHFRCVFTELLRVRRIARVSPCVAIASYILRANHWVHLFSHADSAFLQNKRKLSRPTTPSTYGKIRTRLGQLALAISPRKSPRNLLIAQRNLYHYSPKLFLSSKFVHSRIRLEILPWNTCLQTSIAKGLGPDNWKNKIDFKHCLKVNYGKNAL